VSAWIDKYGWKQEREARMNGDRNRISEIKELISLLTQKRMKLFKDAAQHTQDGNMEKAIDCNKEGSVTSDEVSRWNKTLENLDERNRISLSLYIEVMDDLFNSIHKSHPKVYRELLDFQEEHLSHISLKYN
jgi:hypothetical protein